MVDGQPAVAGTEVTVVAEGNTVARTTVTNEGFFGDERSNRLGVSSIYQIVTMYVDGVEAQTLDLSGYITGEVVSLDLTASSPAPVTDAGTKTTTSGSSGGGGGFSSVGAGEEIETTSATEEVGDEQEIVLQGPSEDLNAEEGEPVPVSTSQGSNAIVVLGIVLVVAVIGIYMYKTRK
ncbi:hypothetical protein V7O66_06085 [Methanolobus sp. ZRKC3]|uniref:hypothetical protein n=1 Tax=Methanolobus sp. ZRKC3 TaxID=3125786 RepID=UPI00324B0C19